jgi:hypothetical protein
MVLVLTLLQYRGQTKSQARAEYIPPNVFYGIHQSVFYFNPVPPTPQEIHPAIKSRGGRCEGVNYNPDL